MTTSSVVPAIAFAGASSPGNLGPFSLIKSGTPIASDDATIHVLRYSTVTDDAPEILVEGTDFDRSTNAVTLTSPQTGLLTTERLFVYREGTIEQLLDLTSGGNYSGEALEARFDRLTEFVEEIARKADTAVRFTPFSTDALPNNFPMEAAIDKIVYLTGTPASPSFATIDNPAALLTNAAALVPYVDAIEDVAADLTGADTIGVVAADLAGDDDIGTTAAEINNGNFAAVAAAIDNGDIPTSAAGLDAKQNTLIYPADYTALKALTADQIASAGTVTVLDAARGGEFEIVTDTSGNVTAALAADPREAVSVALTNGGGTKYARRIVKGAVYEAEWFGVSTSVADNGVLINDAFDLLGNFADLLLPDGVLPFTTPIVLGDATGSVRATKGNGIRVIGRGAGVSAGQYGAPNTGTVLRWDGTDSVNSKCFELRGPLHSPYLQGFFIDMNFAAGQGIHERHCFAPRMRDVKLMQPKPSSTVFAWFMEALDVDFSSVYLGVNGGLMEGKYVDCGIVLPQEDGSVVTETRGLHIKGGATNNVGASRIDLGNFIIHRGVSDDSIGIREEYTDQIISYGMFNVAPNGPNVASKGPDTGIAIQRLVSSGHTFSKENVHTAPILLGALDTVDDTTLLDVDGYGGTELVIGLRASDDYSGTVTPGYGWKIITGEGAFIGFNDTRQFTNVLQGQVDPGVAIPADTTTRYYPLSGVNTSAASATTYQNRFAKPGAVLLLGVNLVTAPGGSATRTFTLMKNGVATAATVTFDSGDSGFDETEFFIGHSAGDYFSLKSEVGGSGNPVISQADWVMHQIYTLDMLPLSANA